MWRERGVSGPTFGADTRPDPHEDYTLSAGEDTHTHDRYILRILRASISTRTSRKYVSETVRGLPVQRWGGQTVSTPPRLRGGLECARIMRFPSTLG